MKGFEEMVLEFHEKYGHWVYAKWGEPPVEVRLLRLRLIVEELGELAEAVQVGPGNVVEIADAAADLGYVLAGTSVSLGLGLDDHRLEVKSYPACLPAVVQACGKLACSLHQGDRVQLALDLSEMMQAVIWVSQEYYFPYYTVFAEVHRSNMTKEVKNLKTGEKYGDKTGKGSSYEPPRLKEILNVR